MARRSGWTAFIFYKAYTLFKKSKRIDTHKKMISGKGYRVTPLKLWYLRGIRYSSEISGVCSWISRRQVGRPSSPQCSMSRSIRIDALSRWEWVFFSTRGLLLICPTKKNIQKNKAKIIFLANPVVDGEQKTLHQKKLEIGYDSDLPSSSQVEFHWWFMFG